MPAVVAAVDASGGGVLLSLMKKLLFAMAIGAFMAWCFDPEQGTRRRELVRTKLADTGLTSASSTPPAPQR